MMYSSKKQKINYQSILDETIKSIIFNSNNIAKKPNLLLHSCCGPCSSYVLSYLKDFFNIYLLFYNPNIYPLNEFNHRKEEQLRLLSYPEFSSVNFVESNYNQEEFFSAIKGYENEKEGNKRCEICCKLRLKKVADIAKNLNFDFFTTTLTVSPYKNSEIINSIGANLEKITGKRYLLSDFKKKDGYKKSIELSKKYNLYRQNYCGCIFSKRWNLKINMD